MNHTRKEIKEILSHLQEWGNVVNLQDWADAIILAFIELGWKGPKKDVKRKFTVITQYRDKKPKVTRV